MPKTTENSMPEISADAAKKIAIQMMKEKGRGAILVGAARIDTALENLLKSVMTTCSKEDNLFKPDRPLGTFSAKISLAARLSLIEKPVETAIQAIRKTRNDFAHSSEDISIADNSHHSRLSEAYTNARKSSLWSVMEKLLTDEVPEIEKPLRDYMILIIVLVAFIEACVCLQEKFSPAIPVRFSKSVET